MVWLHFGYWKISISIAEEREMETKAYTEISRKCIFAIAITLPVNTVTVVKEEGDTGQG